LISVYSKYPPVLGYGILHIIYYIYILKTVSSRGQQWLNSKGSFLSLEDHRFDSYSGHTHVSSNDARTNLFQISTKIVQIMVLGSIGM
jgi:hypothetical protein